MTAQSTPPVAASALDLIGRTPMVELQGFDTGPCRLFVKLESANPGGSIKDRIARSMIEAAEADGRLKPGGTIVEATSGNTGIALAMVGAARGYKVILTMPASMSKERRVLLKAFGAELVLKATKVDGVYSADPKKDPSAQRYVRLSFDEAIAKNLGIMDATAFALCRDQNLPIKVFSIFKHGALKRVVMGEDEGTLVHALETR